MSNTSILVSTKGLHRTITIAVIVLLLSALAAAPARGEDDATTSGWSWPGDWNIPTPINRCPATTPTSNDPCTFTATDAASWATAAASVCQTCNGRKWNTLYVPSSADFTFTRPASGTFNLQTAIACSNVVIWVDGKVRWPAWTGGTASPLGTFSDGSIVQDALLIGPASGTAATNIAVCGQGLFDGGATASNFPQAYDKSIHLLQFQNINGLTVSGASKSNFLNFANSPQKGIWYSKVQNGFIQYVGVLSAVNWNSCDGMDFFKCNTIEAQYLKIQAGDDNIAVANMNQNIYIHDSNFYEGHSTAIGSFGSGDTASAAPQCNYNIRFERITHSQPRWGVHIKPKLNAVAWKLVFKSYCVLGPYQGVSVDNAYYDTQSGKYLTQIAFDDFDVYQGDSTKTCPDRITGVSNGVPYPPVDSTHGNQVLSSNGKVQNKYLASENIVPDGGQTYIIFNDFQVHASSQTISGNQFIATGYQKDDTQFCLSGGTSPDLVGTNPNKMTIEKHSDCSTKWSGYKVTPPSDKRCSGWPSAASAAPAAPQAPSARPGVKHEL